MSIAGISAGYDVGVSSAASKVKSDIADQSFAALLKSDGKSVGTPLTPSATQPDADTKPTSNIKNEKIKEKSPAELFLDYMNKTPAQRWREAWLKQHGLTEEQFAALEPEKRKALEAQMEQDMKEQVRQTAEKKVVDPSVI